MVRLSASPRTILAALPRRENRFRRGHRADGVFAVRHLMHPHGRAREFWRNCSRRLTVLLLQAWDGPALGSRRVPAPRESPLASAAENFDVRRALSAQFRRG